MRLALAFAALVLLAGVAVAIAAARSGGSGASASKFHEPSVSPSCVPSRLNVSAALAGARVTVSPEPDSRDASVSTQISMLGPSASELADVTVRGSSSGAHAGRLVAYSQGDGASFVPSRPFTQGERVSVHAELRSRSRGASRRPSRITAAKPAAAHGRHRNRPLTRAFARAQTCARRRSP
jgi:hypothetical protein